MSEHNDRPLRVLIADPSELFRRGVQDVLSSDTKRRYNVVAELASGSEALLAYDSLSPDVTFLGVPGVPGLSFYLREIAARDAKARVIALLERQEVEVVLQAIQSGASGILLRNESASAILEAAHDVVEGGAALDLRLARTLFDYLAASPASTGAGGPVLDPAALTMLSPREQEVLHALARGHRNKEIAATLGVSVGTVKTHLRHIFRKLKVGDRTSAVLFALHVRPEAA